MDGSFPFLCFGKSWQEGTFPLHPRVPIRKRQGISNHARTEIRQKFILYISWMAHVDLSPNNHSLTPEMLDENLAKLRERQAGFTCPEAEPGRLIETMLFDLNRCDCLRYTQLDRLGGTWHRAQTPLQTTLRSLAKSCLFGKHCQRLGPLTKAQVQQHCQNKPTRGQRQACRKDFVKQAHVMTVGISKPGTEDTVPFCMDRTIALPW